MIDSGDTAWVLAASALVLFMTPGLGFFYAGFTRSKNAIGTIMQSFIVMGLVGVLFLDMGNAFAEGDNLLNVDEWRYGTGGAVQWFSPFGPLMLVLGAPLDPLDTEKSLVFEFSVGGGVF